MRHAYVSGVVDGAKIEEEAYRRTRDDRFANEDKSTLIHYHGYSIECPLSGLASLSIEAAQRLVQHKLVTPEVE